MVDAVDNFAKLPPGMTTRTRNRLITVFILLFPFVLFCGFLVSELNGPLPPIAPLPNPNGYDDLVKAGQRVSSNSWNFAQMTAEQLREIVSANAGSLALARTGLSQECRVPVQFSTRYIEGHFSELAGFKRLAQAFMAEGRQAENEGRFGAAAMTYLDLVRLGNDTARGGPLIDALVGVAVENLGVAGLQKISGQLEAKSCREAAATLEALDAQRQPWSDVLQQEHAWSLQTYPGIRYRLAELVMSSSARKAIQKAGQKFAEQERKTRQLTVDMAARAYELEKGHRPASPAELVPDYLKTIPQDPITGNNLD
ncbi:MAG: hypothetical protein WAO02_08240 [Verrucomicrobiia bacterium]